MGRRKKQPVPDVEVTSRDFVLARIAAARALMRLAGESLDVLENIFLEPDDDPKGEERAELLEDALNQIGSATRSLECAEQALPAVDMEEIEPWDAEDEDE